MMAALVLIASATQATFGQVPEDQQREQQRRDELRIAVQEICPISGQKLGSMGEPVKVQVGEEIVFLCCKGCIQQKIKPEHWAKIHANCAKAQRICPVMKHELPKKPKWTIVEGEVIYVCCPPCIEKTAAEPQEYLLAVDELYIAALEARKRSK
jgi:hypothetical protein